MNDTRYLFFSGKGGVGKTTMACASAVHYAERGLRTLIITTDPASNLADVFETKIGHHIRPLGINHLWGMEIDPDRATEEYRDRVLAPMRAVMPENVLKVMEEQFNSPCTTEIAAFDRFVDFMTEESGHDGFPYDVVIFDTAPTGHTVRLLELPVDWSKHIEESAKGSGNTCIGPVASIQENKKKYDAAAALLGDSSRTDFVFVLQPEETSLYETKRSQKELETIGVKGIRFIVNGLLPEAVCEHPFFRTRRDMQQRYLLRIREEFDGPKSFLYLRDGEIAGIPALSDIARDLFAGSAAEGGATGGRDSKAKRAVAKSAEQSGCVPASRDPAPPADSVTAVPRPASLAELIDLKPGTTKAIYFTGKGGVGKTVVSSAVAYALAGERHRTLLLSTDPASHIAQVFEQSFGDMISKVDGVENLDAVIIDQKKAVEEYKVRILDEARAKYSPDMLIAVKEELESPCTEEMAAFDKFMHYVEFEDYEVVVFDTAPTGHTLRLLELPFDYSEQVGMMVSTTGASAEVKSATQLRFHRIIRQMKDPERSIFVFVVYPESTPVVEAHRAFLDLHHAGIDAQFVVANQMLSPEYCTNGYFRKRLAMQQRHFAEIAERFNLPVARLPLFETEILGIDMIARAARALFEPTDASEGAGRRWHG
jgi:arsenite-transporting ATPase